MTTQRFLAAVLCLVSSFAFADATVPTADETGTADVADLDLLGLEGFRDEDRVELDRATGLDAEPLYGPLRTPSRAPQEVLARG